MIRSADFDRTFIDKILAEPGGEHLRTCWSGGTCASACLVRRFDSEYNPRLILHKAGLGLRDAVLSSAEIWQCSACDACYPRCPRQIHISDVMKAIRQVAIQEGYQRPGVTAEVNVASCIACGLCAAACPYEAINLKTVEYEGGTKQAATVDQNLCMSCGICNSVLLSSSIRVPGYLDETINKSLGEALPSRPVDKEASPAMPQALVIACNWCLHAGKDWEYAKNPPEGVKVVNVPCSGRVTPTFVATALQAGVSGVLVVGCKEDECHYKHGNALEKGRVAMLQNLLELLGIERERAQFAWLGSLDRGKFPELVNKMVQDVQAMGPLSWGE